MKDLNKQKFEEQWQEAFREAEASPSGDLWARIDAHLANQETKKYKRKLVWFQRVAAGLVLLLLGSGAWLWLGQPSQVTTEVNVANQTGSSESQRAAISLDSQSNSTAIAKSPAPLEAPQSTKAAEEGSPLLAAPATQENTPGQKPANLATAPFTNPPKPGYTAERPSSQSSTEALPGQALSAKGAARTHYALNAPQKAKRTARPAISTPRSDADSEGIATAKEPFDNESVKDKVFAPESGYLSIGALSAKGLAAKEPVIRPRSILPHLNEAYWAKIMAEEEEQESKKIDRWQVGVAFAPSTFQPNFRINEGSPTFVNTVNTQAASFGSARADVSSLSSANRELESATAAGLSYQTGLRLEYAISRRFSLQSGVDYLYNSSSISTNSYVQNYYSNKNEPAFAAILNYGNQAEAIPLTSVDASPNLSYSNADYSTKNLSKTASSIAVQNVYEYLGFPIKLNYRLLDKKIGATVGAGVSGDLFLKNRFGNEEAGIDNVNLTSTKGTAYRTLGISAWLGVKMQYRFADKYSFFLEPSYRSAITSFTNTNALQSRPSMFGIGTGLQMRF